MPRKRKSRIYLKDGCYYGDFRDIGGRCEALKPPGERFATTDADVAMVLAGDRVKQLQSLRRGNHILGRNDVPTLGVSFAYPSGLSKLASCLQKTAAPAPRSGPQMTLSGLISWC